MLELVLVPNRGRDGPHYANPDPHPPSEHLNWKGDHPSLPRLSIYLTTNILPPSILNQVDNTSPRSTRSPSSPNPHNPPEPSFRKEQCPNPRNFNNLPFSRELPNYPPIHGKGKDGCGDLGQSIGPLLQTLNQPPHEHSNALCNILYAPQRITSEPADPSTHGIEIWSCPYD